jgi:hypothetical protein
MTLAILLFLIVLGVLIGTGQAKAILLGLGALGVGILVLLTPIWLFAAYCLVWFIGIESYEALGPLGPLTALLTPWAVASLWKRLARLSALGIRDSQAATGVLMTGDSAPSPTWGERIAHAPDMRRAYPAERLSDRRDHADDPAGIGEQGEPDTATALAALLSAMAPLASNPKHPLASEYAALRTTLEQLDLTDDQRVEEATRAVQALDARARATLPHHALMADKAKRRPEKKHYGDG